ncbi:transcriptional adapter 2-alpha-like [Lytechinus variegatus]|uniref:transcriptional adapter 2-alpha-like n=1 Tax=Lytechinus variegatus TaxID=7654 RepID=UPI001BB21E19|nr:transcriptional adapter 2-alpha-like [Lytechinus variegatus]
MMASLSGLPFGLQSMDQPPCPGCSSFLMEPYIRCATCGPPKIDLCLQCFSKGWEDGKHQSNHDYEIITNSFSLFDPNWTAKEEKALLEGVSDYGLGNWYDVSNQVAGKTRLECEQHYNKVYIDNPKPPLFALPMQAELPKRTSLPYRMCEDPPRPARDSQKASSEMAGYMPARSDFNMEYDNYAELDIKDIYFHNETDELLEELKFATVDIYHSRQTERYRRKLIVRNLGLVNLLRIQMVERTHSQAIRDMVEKLHRLCRLHTPVAHDKFIEGLIYEQDLKNEIKKLQEYRRCGIKTFVGADVYNRLKSRREQMKDRKNLLGEVLSITRDPNACQQWLKRQALLETGHKELPPISAGPVRKQTPPLDLTGFVGYDKLNENEKELCATLRIIPEAYFEYKTLFINESQRLGFLKLKQARTLIRIDVNKTRKIYDFFVKEKLIKAS